MSCVDSGSNPEMQTGYPEAPKYKVIWAFLQLIKEGLDNLNASPFLFSNPELGFFMSLGVSSKDLKSKDSTFGFCTCD